MIHWFDAQLILQIGAHVMHGPLVLRPAGPNSYNSIVRGFIGPKPHLIFHGFGKEHIAI